MLFKFNDSGKPNKVGNFFEEGLVDNVLYPLKKNFLRKKDI